MSVFISYRRIDTQQAAGRLADHLMERFGQEAVVIDVDTDQVGRDYREVIAQHLEVADVVLALIGPRFMDQGADGRRRLDQPNDLLRMELTRALQRGVPVVPVLVDGAELPDPDDLPAELRPLIYRGSLELAHVRFRDDYARLERAVERFLSEEDEGKAVEEAEREAPEETERRPAEQTEGEAAERVIERTLVVTLEEAYTGARKMLTVNGRSHEVEVPAGVVDRQRLAFEEVDGSGSDVGGDPHVTVKVAPHTVYDRDGNDLLTQHTVSQEEAHTGAIVEVNVPGGRVEVEVPPGASNGDLVRVPGAGFPATSGVRGDLVVALDVAPPRSATLEGNGRIATTEPRDREQEAAAAGEGPVVVGETGRGEAADAPTKLPPWAAGLAIVARKNTMLTSAIAVAVLIGTIALWAATSSPSADTAGSATEPTVRTPETTVDAQAAEAPVGGIAEDPAGGGGLVCVVTDVGGRDDTGFNAAAWDGAQRAAVDVGGEARVLESLTDADYVTNIDSFVDQGCDLIVTVGFLLWEATLSAAVENPDVDFAIVDWAEEAPPPNLRSLVFNVQEAAFLAGYTAAGMTETGRVGTFGGVNIPPVTDYMDGFAWGVEHYNREKGTTIEVLGWDPDTKNGSLTGNFVDLNDGRAFAQSFVDEGADIIMPVAGPVGLGTSALASELGTFLVVGVDYDWTVVDPQNAAVVLTSAVKQIANAVHETTLDALGGNHTNDLYVGTLANGGVAMSPNNFDAVVPADLKAEVEALRQAIATGTITVGT